MSATSRASARRISLWLDVQLGNGVRACPFERAQLRRWMAAVLSVPAQLTLRLVNRAEARVLNGRFRSRDYSPDVLTFAYGTEDSGRLSADIVICLPVAREQARSASIPFQARFAHLLMHGVLHAQGHEHDDPEEAEVMEALEIAALRRFGFDDPYA
jgi:probable rRNA maturation factor